MRCGLISVFALILVVSGFLLLGLVMPKKELKREILHDNFVNIQGARIYYNKIERDGPTVIMLHGFGGNSTDWTQLANSLQGVRVVTLDLIGFGNSDAPSDITYDIETHKKYLLGFMDALKIRRAVLVGSSMGASLALWTAGRSPERVSGLILFAPSGYPGSMRHRWPGNMVYRPNALNKVMRMVVHTGFFNALFPESLAQQALDVTSSYDSSFVHNLAAVHQPTLLVWSKGDARVPFSYSDIYRKLLPQARFIEAPAGAGHGAAGNPTPEIVAGLYKIVEQSWDSGKMSDL